MIDQTIPTDKSWFLRVAFLRFLQGERTPAPEDANLDILSFSQSLEAWSQGETEIPIGESGTGYRFLQFLAWKKGIPKKFLRGPMLAARKVCQDPSIVNLSQEELLKLDGGTSQWASAAALCGDKTRIENPPNKLALTYEAIASTNPDPIRPDQTIEAQACAYFGALALGAMNFTPKHSEDFCFAYTFGKINLEEAKKRWPSLAHHESNRLVEMPTQLKNLFHGENITSTDHRVIQAIALKATQRRIPCRIQHPQAVAKSWPQFWEFLRETNPIGYESISR